MKQQSQHDYKERRLQDRFPYEFVFCGATVKLYLTILMTIDILLMMLLAGGSWITSALLGLIVIAFPCIACITSFIVGMYSLVYHHNKAMRIFRLILVLRILLEIIVGVALIVFWLIQAFQAEAQSSWNPRHFFAIVFAAITAFFLYYIWHVAGKAAEYIKDREPDGFCAVVVQERERKQTVEPKY